MQASLIPALNENPLDVRLSASFASLALAKSSMARSGRKTIRLLSLLVRLMECKNAIS